MFDHSYTVPLHGSYSGHSGTNHGPRLAWLDHSPYPMNEMRTTQVHCAAQARYEFRQVVRMRNGTAIAMCLKGKIVKTRRLLLAQLRSIVMTTRYILAWTRVFIYVSISCVHMS